MKTLDRRTFIRDGVKALSSLILTSGACKLFNPSVEYYILERNDGKYLKIEDINAFYKLEKSPKNVENIVIKTPEGGEWTASSLGQVQGSTGIYSPTLVSVLTDYNVQQKEVTVKNNRMNLLPTDRPVIAKERYRKNDSLYQILKIEFERGNVKRYIMQ